MLLVLVLIGLTTSPIAAVDNSRVSMADRITTDSVVILPPANYTNEPDAVSNTVAILRQVAARQGLALTAPREIRPLLRRYRVRAIGFLDRDGARHLRDASGAKYCLAVAINAYADKRPPLFGLSLRLLRLSDLRVIWAGSRGADGTQFRRWFGKGEVTSIDTLLTRVTEGLVTDMINRRRSLSVAVPGCTTAIVPFDNLEPDGHAADILSGYLMATLVQSGVTVIEPGIIREMFSRAGRWTRGEVTYDFMDLLRDSLGVDFVLTGTLDTYRKETGGQPAVISVGARLLDTRAHRVTGAIEVCKTAHQGTGVLATGRAYVGDSILRHAAAEIVEKLYKTTRSFTVANDTSE